MARKWTKRAALRRLKEDELVQEAMQVEPKIREVIEMAKAQKDDEEGYDRILTYARLKNQVFPFVGWYCEKPQIKTSEHYAAVLAAILDLLPLDEIDLELAGE